MFDRIVTELNALDVAAMGLAGLHETAAGAKRVRAAVDALEARLLTAAADRTFDPAAGMELLRDSGGCSQREARRRLRRAEVLNQMPAVAGALAEGDITAEHADALVQAARTTSAETVDTDAGLLEKAKALPADLAGREVADWAHRHQTAADREAKFRRQRAMRSHRAWCDGEGMVNFRTRLDPVTGAQARAVIDDIANRLYRADGGRDAKPDQIRTWDQRNADAFTAALGITPTPAPDHDNGPGTASDAGSNPSPRRRAGEQDPNPGPGAPGEPVPDSRANTAKEQEPKPGLVPDGRANTAGEQEPKPGPGAPGRGVARGSASAPLAATTAPVTGPAGRDTPQPLVTGPAGRGNPQPASRDAPQPPVTGPAGRPGPSLRNQILVIAHTDAITGADPDARCEIPGTGPIPRSELERLACEADLFGALFSRDGLPLWHGRKTRTVSPQQWRMLIARDRGCVLCAASPSHCHAHHIVPWTAPVHGPTDIDNLVLVCNRHHHHIHQHNLTLTRAPNGQWATHTPNQPRPTRTARKPVSLDSASPSSPSNRSNPAGLNLRDNWDSRVEAVDPSNRSNPASRNRASVQGYVPAPRPPAKIRAGP